MSRITSMLAAVFLGFFGADTQAQMETFGDYTVYYSAVNSTFITPDIARQYGITRGERNAFLNISVQKKTEGKLEAVTAQISGSKKNLLQQSAALNFSEVKEGEAIYYIGEFEFTNAEPVVFELNIKPEGEARAFPLKWDTRVYINN